MGRALKNAAALGLVTAGVYPLLGAFGACAGSNEARPKDAAADPTPSDAKKESAADAGDGAALPPWDPVWHKTTPADFAVIPPGPLLAIDCGERCKVIASSEPDAIDTRRPRANDDWVVFQVPPGRVHAVHLKTGVEYLVDDGSDWEDAFGAGVVSLSGRWTFYGVATVGASEMVVRDLITGERKTVWRAVGEKIGDGTSTTAFEHPYVYWEHGTPNRMYRFNLLTGELRSVDGGGCLMMEGTSTGLATCASEGWIDLIDFDKNQYIPIGTNDAAEGSGGISPDAKTIVWQDFRNPGPSGEKGTYEQPVAGSEIYALDLATQTETRLTFDAPVLKTMPRVVGDTIVWHSWADSSTPTPVHILAHNWSMPVWFTKAGQPARRLSPAQLSHAQPITSGAVGVWVQKSDAGAGEAGVVHIAWPPDDDAGSADAQAQDAEPDSD